MRFISRCVASFQARKRISSEAEASQKRYRKSKFIIKSWTHHFGAFPCDVSFLFYKILTLFIHSGQSGISCAFSSSRPQSLQALSEAFTKIPAPISSKANSAPISSPYFFRSSFGITILPRLSTFRIKISPKKTKSAATEVNRTEKRQLHLLLHNSQQREVIPYLPRGIGIFT